MRRVPSGDRIMTRVSSHDKMQQMERRRTVKDLLMERYKCKFTRKYRNCALVTGSILVTYSNIWYNDYTISEIGSLLTTCYFGIGLCYSYVDNYLQQLDQWRMEEANYEEKTEPPEWNWKIINNINHIGIVLNLLASISDDIGVFNLLYFYVGCVLQLVAIGCKVYTCKSPKTITSSVLGVSSIACFMCFSRGAQFGAILGLASEIVSL